MKKISLSALLSMCSVFVFGILFLVPSTRPFAQQAYSNLGGQPPEYIDWRDTFGSTDPYVQTYTNYKEVFDPFHLARVLEKDRTAFKWALVIRRIGPFPRTQTRLSEIDKIQNKTVEKLELGLYACREGARAEPDNGFFPLSEACYSASQNDQKQTLACLKRVAHSSRFDDYLILEYQLVLRAPESNPIQNTFTYRGLTLSSMTSSPNSQWPYLASAIRHWRSAAESSDQKRLINDLDRALIIVSTKLSTLALMNSTKRTFLQLPVRLFAAPRLANSGMTVPITDAEIEVASRFAIANGLNSESMAILTLRELLNSRNEMLVNEGDLNDYTSTRASSAVAGLLLALLISGVLWIGGILEGSGAGILKLYGFIVAAGCSIFLLNSRELFAIPLAMVGLSLFVAFLIIRLVGYEKIGLILVAASSLFTLIWSYFGGNIGFSLSVLGMWCIPFMLAYLTKFALPKWTIPYLGFLLISVPIYFGCREITSYQMSHSNWQISQLTTVLVGLSFFGTVAFAITMGLTKLPFWELSKQLSKAVPAVFFGISLWFLTSIKDDLNMEAKWKAMIDSEIPTSTQAIAFKNIRNEH